MSFIQREFQARVCSALLLLVAFQPRAFCQDSLWRSFFNSAQQAYRAHNYAEADKNLRSALDAARKYEDSVSTFYYLARTAEKLGRLEQAEGYYQTVLEYMGPKIWSVLRPPEGALDWDDSTAPDSNLPLDSQEFAKQFAHRKQPYSTRLAKPITTVDVLSDTGLLLQREHKYEKAEQVLRQALELCEHRPYSSSVGQIGVMQKLSMLYLAEGKPDQAEALQRQMNDLRDNTFPEFNKLVAKNINELDRFGANGALVATRLNNLALYCATHGDYSRAESLYQRSLSNCKTSPVSRKDVSIILRNYADLLQAMGKNDEALKYLKQADTYRDVAGQALHEANSFE